MATPIRESISSAADKIQEIVETAERVAREIQAEAKADAARYREEARLEADALVAGRADRLKQLSASLREHADRVRAEVLDLSAELGRAASELRGEGEPVTPPSPGGGHESSETSDRGRTGWLRRRSPSGTPSSGGTPQPVAYPGTAEAAGDAVISDEVLLRATQMAVAGSSRAEIEEALRRDFDLANPGAVLDDILGRAAAS